MNDKDPVSKKEKPKKISKAKLFLTESESYAPEKRHWVPDWGQISNYPKDGIARQHWAWEFLRRNKHFQKECDDPSISIQDDTGVISLEFKHRWGLDEIKPYFSEFRPAKKEAKLRTNKQSPIWAAIKPARFIDTTSGPASQKPIHNVALDLHSGQVAVVYDLNFAVLDSRMLDMQIARSVEMLEDGLKCLRKKKNEKETDSASRTSWQNALRVADAFAASDPPSRTEIGKQLQKDGAILARNKAETDLLVDEDFSKAISPIMTAAYELIYEGGYLRLLTDPSYLEKINKKFATQTKA